jgi:hypothetical protein
METWHLWALRIDRSMNILHEFDTVYIYIIINDGIIIINYVPFPKNVTRKPCWNKWVMVILSSYGPTVFPIIQWLYDNMMMIYLMDHECYFICHLIW